MKGAESVESCSEFEFDERANFGGGDHAVYWARLSRWLMK